MNIEWMYYNGQLWFYLAGFQRHTAPSALVIHRLDGKGIALEFRLICAAEPVAGFIYRASEDDTDTLSSLLLAIYDHPDEWPPLIDYLQDDERTVCWMRRTLILNHNGLQLVRGTLEPWDNDGRASGDGWNTWSLRYPLALPEEEATIPDWAPLWRPRTPETSRQGRHWMGIPREEFYAGPNWRKCRGSEWWGLVSHNGDGLGGLWATLEDALNDL